MSSLCTVIANKKGAFVFVQQWQELSGDGRTSRDPFDRLIVSATLATSARLVSKDEVLADSGLVHVVW
jgi:PIN domain nuclease of toxin-antitoxin system